MKNVKITIAASIATAYTEAARDIVHKRHATPKLSPKIHSLSVALRSCEASQEQSRTLGKAT